MPLPTYLMSNFPSVRPSLNLQFDSQPTPEDMTSHLASVGATFSRASIGTYTDANGIIQEATSGQARPNYSTDGVHEGLLIEESRTNEITSSEDFNTTDWTLTNIDNVISNQAIAPDGTASADEVAVSAGSSVSLQFITFSLVGDYVGSVFVKAGTLDFVQLNVPNQTNASTSNFDLVNGTVNDIHGNGGSIEDYGNGWYRCKLNFSQTSGNGGIAITPVGSLSASRRVASSGSVYVWGAQIEEGSFPTSYIPTIPTFTSRASDGTYFDSSGILQTASTDVARTDHKYIDGQWVEAGLLLEGEATNLLVRSQDLSTTWDTTNTTVTTNQVNGLDGTLTADLLKEDSDSTTHYLSQSGTFSSGTTYTFSTFAKNASGTRYLQLRVFGIGGNHAFVNFDLVNGEIPASGSGGDDLISATIEDVGSGWYRCSMTANYSASPTGFLFGISNSATAELPNYTGDNTSGFYIWGAQVEAQNQATSYIKTVGSTATRSADVYTTATKTRSADVCYIDGTAFTDFYNQEEGTTFVNAMCEADSGASRFIYEFSNGTSSERMYGFLTSSDAISNNVIDSGSAQAPFTGSAVTLGTFFKTAYRYNTDSFNQVTDGTASTPDTSGNVSTNDRIYIGATDTPSAFFNGYIKKLIYFPRQLSDNELIKLTQ